MIYVGTCGYSYKDWIGSFYPATIRQSEMLRYYARSFGAVEVDAGYYGVLPKATVERMNVRTPEAFLFCFKAPSSLTHRADVKTAAVLPDARAFVESLEPVAASGKLGCALLQFPNSFQPNELTRRYVRVLSQALAPLPLVAEFRHRDWQTSETIDLLSQLGVGWCNVDMPSYESLMRASSDVTSRVGYVRFHGRNAQQWWSGTNVTRYDYLYTAEELAPWADRLAEIDERAETTFAFFNNHARGNAARNAEMFSDLLRARCGEPAGLPGSREAPPAQRGLFE